MIKSEATPGRDTQWATCEQRKNQLFKLLFSASNFLRESSDRIIVNN